MQAIAPSTRSVVLAGATGLVGSLILEALLADPGVARIQVLARRPLRTSHPKLRVEVVDFSRLRALVIAQSSLLLGDRRALNQPPRFGEGFAAPIMKLISPILPRQFRPVHGDSVALALVGTLPTAQGLVVLSSDELARLGSI